MDQFALGIASVTVGFALSDYAEARGKRVEEWLRYALALPGFGILFYLLLFR